MYLLSVLLFLFCHPLVLLPSPSSLLPPFCHRVQMLKLQRLRESCRGNGTSSCILCGHDFAHHRSRSPISLHFCHECAKVWMSTHKCVYMCMVLAGACIHVLYCTCLATNQPPSLGGVAPTCCPTH